MKTLKRYKIDLSFAQEVGIYCAYVEVSTNTKKWGNGPIVTDAKGFSVLTRKIRTAVRRALRKWGSADALLSAVWDEQVPDIEEEDVRMVMAGCRTTQPYLYVSDSEEFMNEQDLVSFAKEGELLED